MKFNFEGFYSAYVDDSLCVNCAECYNYCPLVNNNLKYSDEYEFYVGQNLNDEIRMNSSSGGIFHSIAKTILQKNGVVFGVGYNESMEVVHLEVDDISGLSKIMGSKYVQSQTGTTYERVENLLQENKLVMYSGTPCQIAGLKKFLDKNYDNLYTVSVVCFGVSPPQFFQEYINYLEEFYNNKIIDYNFRYRVKNWLDFGTKIFFQNGMTKTWSRKDSFYFYWFLQRLYLSKNCSDCQFRMNNVQSDIWLGDFWKFKKGYEKLVDFKGTSIICVNKRSKNLFSNEIKKSKIDYSQGKKRTPNMYSSRKSHLDRKNFFTKWKSEGFYSVYLSYLRKHLNKNKIGIFTLFGYSNYGNRLQNFALQQFLLQFGFDVETIVVHNVKKVNPYLKQFNDKYIKTRFIESKDINKVKEEYDFFIVGSDQVFNHNFKSFKNMNLFENLKSIPSNKLLTFSASFGVDDIPSTLKGKFNEHLKHYSNISVRENKGQEIVSNILNKEPDILADPVLLINNDWNKLASYKFKDKNSYAFSFFLKKNPYLKQINNICNQYNLDLFNENTLSVVDFLSAIKYSSLVITNSYHVVILSIIFQVPFLLVENREQMTSRFDTLLYNFGLQDRKIMVDEYPVINLLEIDYSSNNKILSTEKDKAIKFLIKAIGMEDKYDKP